MLLGFDRFFIIAQNFRVIAIEGRLGGGKTSFAFRLAYEFLERGKVEYLVSNIKTPWATPIDKWQMNMQTRTMDTVAVLDETGQFADGKQADAYMLGLRKLNMYMLMPSVKDVSSKLRALTIQRVFNAEIVGLPVWVYQWTLKYKRTATKGQFFWVRPAEIYGVYDTKSYPLTDGQIGKKLYREIMKVAEEEEGDPNANNYWQPRPGDIIPDKEDKKQNKDAVSIENQEEENGSKYYDPFREDTIQDAVYQLEEQRREFEDTIQQAQEVARVIPLHSLKRRKGRR